jgi:O-antigen/teichoic acid export membrane protein
MRTLEGILSFGSAAFAVLAVVLLTRAVLGHGELWPAPACAAMANALLAVFWLLRGNAAAATITLLVAAANAWTWWYWWRRRKKRRRALALLGGKARALRDALVRRMRERTQPRPVLSPVPQGR